MPAADVFSHALAALRSMAENGFLGLAAAGYILRILLAFAFNRTSVLFEVLVVATLALALGGAGNMAAVRRFESAQLGFASLTDLRNVAAELEKVNKALATPPY